MPVFITTAAFLKGSAATGGLTAAVVGIDKVTKKFMVKNEKVTA